MHAWYGLVTLGLVLRLYGKLLADQNVVNRCIIMTVIILLLRIIIS